MLRRWEFLFNFNGHHIGFRKKKLPPFELVNWESIGEALQIMCEVLYTV
jgi:hypothetical protein